MSEALIRTFIAIRLPDDVKQWLTQMQRTLRESRIRASWPRPASLHLTLRFLGEIPEHQIDTIAACLKRAVNQHSPFRLSGAGMGCFPSVKNARVLWAGVNGQTDVLQTLVDDLNQSLYKNLNLPKEKKRFSPHLTLARLKQKVPPKTIIRFMQEFEKDASNPFSVQKIELIKSTLTSSGAIHTTLLSEAIE